jgi:hypothetical protein
VSGWCVPRRNRAVAELQRMWRSGDRVKGESGSFLKKRTKTLLSVLAAAFSDRTSLDS